MFGKFFMRSTCRAAWLLAAAATCLATATASGQFTDKVATTPAFLQDGFGPAGDELPFGGENYCSPTAAAMSLGYLGVNGFNQIAPSSPTAAQELNLVEVLAGLMGTSPIQGTSSSGFSAGLQVYLAAKGIGNSNYTITTVSSPTLSNLASLNQNQTVVDLLVGFYNSTDTRIGGHSMALLSQGVNAQGQPSPSTGVINNPRPSVFAPTADLSSNVLQYLNTVPTTGGLTAYGSLEGDPNQYPGFGGSTTGVVETAFGLTVAASQQSVNSPTPATWTLSSNQTIDLQNGSLTVLAPIAGPGGLIKGDGGTLELQSPDGSTGSNAVVTGVLQSDVASGTPFGTGAMQLDAATLALVPASGTANVNLTIASAAGQQFTYSSGGMLALNRNGNTSLTVTLGGNTNGTKANLVRSNSGSTLVIAPSDGIAGLGTTESLIVNGSGSNLPTVTNGIVAASIVGQDSDANASGNFLTYGPGGFAKAAYSQAASLATAGSNAVYDAETPQTLAAGSTVQLYALKVGPITISGAGGTTTLEVIGTGQSGLILNGGKIATTNMTFGPDEGLVYTSLAGGTISATIGRPGSLKTTSSLTAFGPGALTLLGANTYQGPTIVASGTLIAANQSGSATGNGAVTVEQNATLEISGAAAVSGGTGGINVSGGATLFLNGGTAAGPLSMNGYLLGSGTVSGPAIVAGTIGGSATDPSAAAYSGVENVTFAGSSTTFNSVTIYNWRFNALDDAPANAGSIWSLLHFTAQSGIIDLGQKDSPFNFTLDLGAGVDDPNSGDLFWDEPHQWLAAVAPHGFSNISFMDGFPSYEQGFFSLSTDSSDLYVDYTPAAVPEPGSIALLLAGAVTVGIWRLHRRG